MLKRFPFVLFALCIGVLHAQTLNINSQHNLGSAGEDDLFVYPSPNGDGYYLIGSSDGNASFDKSENSRGGDDIWVVKTDTSFVKQWDKTYGGALDEYGVFAVVFDDRILISSTSFSDSSGEKTMDSWGEGDIWNICIDLNGNVVWQQQYGGLNEEAWGTVIKNSDSSILMAVSSRSGISGNKTSVNIGFRDIWLVEVAISDGHIIQQNNIGSSLDEIFPRLAKSEISNKTFMACISQSGAPNNDKTDSGFGNLDVWLVEIDTNLNVLQDKCFGGTSSEYSVNIAIDQDDNLILGVTTQSDSTGNKTVPSISTQLGGNDCWFLKLDSNFSILWDVAYGGSLSQSTGWLIVLPTGEIVANCSSTSDSISGNKTSPHFGMYDAWILFLDSSTGSDLLQTTLGGSGNDFGSILMHPMYTNKFVFSSVSDSPISGNKTVPTNGGMDAWVGVLEYDGLSSILELATKHGVLAFPNPSNGEVSIQFKELPAPAQISFVSVDGKLLDTVPMDAGMRSFTWETSHKGVVFYSISGEHTQLQGKLVFK